MSKIIGSGLFSAALDAIHGADEKLAGQRIHKLSTTLLDGDPDIQVPSTIGFGEFNDGTGDARVVVGGEIIDCSGRTLTSFTGLTRGVGNTTIKPFYPVGTIVYDEARNSSAIDHVRRGMLVEFAIGADLDQVGRNLGLVKCISVADSVWRTVIQEVAYLAKQPLSAVFTAMNALVGTGNFTLFERSVSDPHKFFVTVDVVAATTLQGRFYLNSNEMAVTQLGGIVDTIYPIVDVPTVGVVATGLLHVTAGGLLIDAETFILDDGVNPAVTFEYDDDSTVIETPTLRRIIFNGTQSEEIIRDATLAAIQGAPLLALDSVAVGTSEIALTNQNIGVAGNAAIVETVADPIFVATGMAGGEDVGTQGVVAVWLDTPLAREGIRDGLTNLFTGGSVIGQQILLGTDPGAGVDVLIDYNAFPAHYLPPNDSFRNDGSHFPPYFSDSLAAADCLLDQVRAAGTKAQLGVNLI